jgi:protein-disulfide isomerase
MMAFLKICSFRIAALGAVASLFFGGAALAQGPTKVLDSSALRPPAGASVAIVEFSDMECPACARANPALKAAAEKYRIPWVRRDFVIPAHPWSPTASLYARWFDAQGKGLGDEYRDAVFANQPSIYNVGILTQFTQKFAAGHNVTLPFSVDPQGKLAAEVKADTQMGQRTGIQHTPTVFIVMSHSKGASYVEVENVDRDLYRTIDQALAEAKQAAPAARPTAKKLH